MSIKKLNLLKRPSIKVKLCALSLASVMTITTGCSTSKVNNNLENHEQNSNSAESTEETNLYLDEKSPEIYNIISMMNGEKRGVLLSDEPHPYESIFEKTKTKVYLSDENGNRLSENFDELSLLSNYQYLSVGGVLLGDWKEVETDKQYDHFVGKTLRKDSDNRTLEPGVTLLDNKGSELCSFNGYFEALVENIVVIQEYFEGEDRTIGAPDTYLYNYITDEKSEKHDYVRIFNDKCDQKEKSSYLIGVNLYHENNDYLKCLYSFYDRNLNVVAIASEDEIEKWYQNNDDWEAFNEAAGNYDDYFRSIYQDSKTEENKQLMLKKD